MNLRKPLTNFNASRILGQGGQGTIYQGMLLDGRVVATKKAKQASKSDAEQCKITVEFRLYPSYQQLLLLKSIKSIQFVSMLCN